MDKLGVVFKEFFYLHVLHFFEMYSVLCHTFFL